MTDVQELLESVRTGLGDPTTWASPVEFPNSLALCALNSAYSLRAHSTSGENVIARYRAHRPSADSDTGPDLIEAMDDASGPEAFARDVLNNNSKLPGTNRVRTVGIHEALTRLKAVDVTTTSQLRTKAEETTVKRAWLSVSGLGKLSWSYLLMNAGVENRTKPDVIVQRYLTEVLGDRIEASRAQELLVAVAGELNVTPRRLDRAIWLHGR